MGGQNGGGASGGKHQGGKNPEEGGFSAAVGSQQAEQFCRAHVERNSIQSCSVSVAMHQGLHRNDGVNGRRRYFQIGVGDGGNFRDQRKSRRQLQYQFTAWRRLSANTSRA